MARPTGGLADVVVIILAILVPPIAVLIERGCGAHLVLNIVLCLFGHFPGILHALYLVLVRDGSDGERLRRPRRGGPAAPPYPQQTNQQAMMYGKQQQQQPYWGQGDARKPDDASPRTVAPESMAPPPPPTYADPNYYTPGEKHEYAPVPGAGLPPKAS